jgi:hypothetical protein
VGQIIKRLSALPFAIALFDDAGDAGVSDGGDAGQGNGATAASGANSGVRNGRGQFSRNDSGADRSYPTDLTEAHRLLADQDRRIAELNDESATRRRENKDLRKDLGSLQSRQSLVDQRSIRMEAREALRANGVIDPDVVDLFLKHAGETIKIDDKTGDVVGVGESLAKFKDAKPVFFKAADGGANDGANGQAGSGNGAGSANGNGSGSGAGAGQQGSGQGADADNRGNATGTGASVAGGATGGQGGFKVANFRDSNVNAKDAMARYKASLR